MVDAKALKEANRKAFLDVYPELANEVLEELRKYNMPQDAYEWTKQVHLLHLISRLSFPNSSHLTSPSLVALSA